jgi:hypothetical protein
MENMCGGIVIRLEIAATVPGAAHAVNLNGA